MQANKTELTESIENTASKWLSERGFKLIEREVGYGDQKHFYLADLLAYCEPSFTEFRRLHLLSGHVKEKIVHSEYGISHIRVLDETIPKLIFALIEVKVSRTDYFKDKAGKFSRQWAHLNYIAYPKGMLKSDEIPIGWWSMETSSNGSQILRVQPHFESLYQVPSDDQLTLLLRISDRQVTRERAQPVSDYWKQDRDAIRSYNFSSVLNATASFIRKLGMERSLEEEMHYVAAFRGKLDTSAKDSVENLENLLKELFLIAQNQKPPSQ